MAYHNTYKMPIVVTHTMNVFGERQNPEKFIPGVVSAVKHGKQITIHSDVTRTVPGSRHYIHVRDVVEGLLFVLGLPKDYKHQVGNTKCGNGSYCVPGRGERGHLPQVQPGGTRGD